MRRVTACALTVALFVFSAWTPPARGQGRSEQSPGKFLRVKNRVPDQYIVVLNDDTPAARVASIAADLSRRHGGKTKLVFKHALKGFSVNLPEAAALALSRDPRVKFVEEDGYEKAVATTQTSAPWGLDRIDQRDGRDGNYNYDNTGAGVHAYVLDTGIIPGHSEFGGRASADFDSIDDDFNPFTDSNSDRGGLDGIDCNGHGTHVAGIVGGATYGVAKGVRLHGVRVTDCAGGASDSDIIGGVDWVTGNRISPAVVNMSLRIAPSFALDSAVRNSISSGVPYVVAAGNENSNARNFSPARLVETLTIGAIDMSDVRASFSNFGMPVDLFAPGVQITSAWPDGIPPPFGSDCIVVSTAPNAGAMSCSGTSQAAPHVTGIVALYLQTNPSATPVTVHSDVRKYGSRNRVINTGPNSDNGVAYSRFNFSVPHLAGSIPLFRYWDPTRTDHFYSNNFPQIGWGQFGWEFNWIECNIFPTQAAGTIPLYQFWNPTIGDHFYTVDYGFYPGYTFERVEGYVYNFQAPGTVPLYRYWNPSVGDHFYTTQFDELGFGQYGWTFERVECYVSP